LSRVETFSGERYVARSVALDADLNANNPERAGAPPVALWRRAG
jgi:hypothetical protein